MRLINHLWYLFEQVQPHIKEARFSDEVKSVQGNKAATGFKLNGEERIEIVTECALRQNETALLTQSHVPGVVFVNTGRNRCPFCRR